MATSAFLGFRNSEYPLNFVGYTSIVCTVGRRFHIPLPTYLPWLHVMSGISRICITIFGLALDSSRNSVDKKNAFGHVVRGFAEVFGLGILLFVIDVIVALFRKELKPLLVAIGNTKLVA
ncbi:MAG: hypothetical protein H0X51_05500 [Parachlamydiaceae bacterium]|nr:hypothetical protein [Parachlamydiaceae bacterium]